MGGGGSRYLQFVLNDEVNGQGPEIQLTFDVLKITGDDIHRYWTAFNDLNFDGTGLVTLERFHTFYQLECTPFTEKVFSVMDIDHSGKINFNEYVISTWNYLSCDMDVLTAFAFSLFDIDDSKTLEPDEIQQMVSMVYGGTLTRVANVLEKLDALRNEKGLIERPEFIKFSRRYPLLLFPAFAMQQALRRSIMGEAYWEKIEKLRNEMFSGLTIFDIFKDFTIPVIEMPQIPLPSVASSPSKKAPEPVSPSRKNSTPSRKDSTPSRKLSVVNLTPLK